MQVQMFNQFVVPIAHIGHWAASMAGFLVPIGLIVGFIFYLRASDRFDDDEVTDSELDPDELAVLHDGLAVDGQESTAAQIAD